MLLKRKQADWWAPETQEDFTQLLLCCVLALRQRCSACSGGACSLRNVDRGPTQSWSAPFQGLEDFRYPTPLLLGSPPGPAQAHAPKGGPSEEGQTGARWWHTGAAWTLRRGRPQCVHARLLEKCGGVTVGRGAANLGTRLGSNFSYSLECFLKVSLPNGHLFTTFHILGEAHVSGI